MQSPQDAVAFAAASTTALALHELYAPTTTPPRRAELQALLHLERATAAADANLRAIWRRVLGSSQDELLLWFALSTCETYLRTDAAVSNVPAAERQELKAGLTEMLLGASAAALPRWPQQGVLMLAQLARCAWPAEEPALMQEILSLVQQPGTRRELGGHLIAAVAEEFAAADARQKQALRQAAFVAFLPVAYAALADALHAEAASTPTSASVVACIDAARALLGFGRLRDGNNSAAANGGARSFTPDEVTALPNLLLAVCAHLAPSHH